MRRGGIGAQTERAIGFGAETDNLKGCTLLFGIEFRWITRQMACVWRNFCFMAKKKRQKEKRYIQFRSLRWRVPNGEWGDYLRRGLIERVSSRVARLRQGVEIVYEGGRHLLRDLARKIEASIPSSWELVERAARYATNGPNLSPEALQREIQSDYGRTFEAWEAV